MLHVKIFLLLALSSAKIVYYLRIWSYYQVNIQSTSYSYKIH